MHRLGHYPGTATCGLIPEVMIARLVVVTQLVNELEKGIEDPLLLARVQLADGLRKMPV